MTGERVSPCGGAAPRAAALLCTRHHRHHRRRLLLPRLPDDVVVDDDDDDDDEVKEEEEKKKKKRKKKKEKKKTKKKKRRCVAADDRLERIDKTKGSGARDCTREIRPLGTQFLAVAAVVATGASKATARAHSGCQRVTRGDTWPQPVGTGRWGSPAARRICRFFLAPKNRRAETAAPLQTKW